LKPKISKSQTQHQIFARDELQKLLKSKNIKWLFLVPGFTKEFENQRTSSDSQCKKLQKKLKSGKWSLNCKRSWINCTPPQHHDEEMLFYLSWSLYRYTKKIMYKILGILVLTKYSNHKSRCKICWSLHQISETSTLIWITKKKANWKTSPVLSTHIPREGERES